MHLSLSLSLSLSLYLSIYLSIYSNPHPSSPSTLSQGAVVNGHTHTLDSWLSHTVVSVPSINRGVPPQHTHTHTHTYTYTNTHKNTHTYTNTYTNANTQGVGRFEPWEQWFTRKLAEPCVCVCMCVCLCVCVCVFVFRFHVYLTAGTSLVLYNKLL